MNRMRAVAFCAAAGAACAAYGQLSDGNFDALAVGTAPDNATPAGAWQFPANYITAVVGEVLPGDYTIAATNSFDPTGSGNSLAININSATANVHLTNIMPTIITQAPGQIVRAKIDVWVQPGMGGGSIYIGADHGGGGFSNATDRGPQLTWFADGTLKYASAPGGVVTNTTIVPVWPTGSWNRLQLDINLNTDTYNAFWGPVAGPMTQVGTNLAFRSATLTNIDRFSFAHFGATVPIDLAFYDNVSIEVINACYPDCNQSGTLTIADFACFQSAFVASQTYADCNNSGTFTIADFACFQSAFVAGCP